MEKESVKSEKWRTERADEDVGFLKKEEGYSSAHSTANEGVRGN
jgi:hypothetical protein